MSKKFDTVLGDMLISRNKEANLSSGMNNQPQHTVTDKPSKRMTQSELIHYGLLGVKSAKAPKVVTPEQDKAAKSKRFAEQDLQTALCKYMRLQYPNVIFHVDAGSAKRRSFFIQNIHKAQQFLPGIPDFFILKPNKGFYGLFLELKVDRYKLYKKNSTERLKSVHHDEQAHFHELLKKQGYYACFACGIDEAKRIIDRYLAV